MGQKEEFYPKLKQLMEEIGDWNVHYLELSQKWDVPKSTIYRWRDKILLEVELPDPYKMGKNSEKALYSAIRQCQLKIKSVKSERDRIDYMNTLINLTRGLTDIQESYSRKQQLTFQNQLNVQQINHVQIIQEIVNELEKKQIKIEDGADITEIEN